jgi:deoxycytidine triphosphate deaminase
MILGAEKLLQLVRENNLVENLSKRELESPEGAGFDLRIGELYEIKGEGFLGVEERDTPQTELITKFNQDEKMEVSLKPKTYYLMKTIEKVNMPKDVLAIFTPRSTLFRSGVYIFGGQVAPGYCGGLTMGMYNFRDEVFKLELGSRVLHLMFFEVRGESNLYRGQWQGGRVTTDKKEKQI